MRNLFRLSALLIVAMLAIVGSRGASSVAAQDDPLSGLGGDLDQYEGIEEAAGRVYMVDYEALMSTPENLENLEMPSGVQGGFFAVLKFDNDDNAEKAMDQLRSEAETSLTEESEGATVEEISHDDLDDDALAYKQTSTDETLGATTTVIIADQDDEYIYVSAVFAFGEGEDPTDLSINTVNDMSEADAGDGDATFNEDGTSEGGIWDKLPDADAQDGAFEGLVASDEQLYPTDGTPEA
jgi:hypothetical protein